MDSHGADNDAVCVSNNRGQALVDGALLGDEAAGVDWKPLLKVGRLRRQYFVHAATPLTPESIAKQAFARFPGKFLSHFLNMKNLKKKLIFIKNRIKLSDELVEVQRGAGGARLTSDLLGP
ncbi:hypothetical protein PO002_22560 [Cupriavidus necator]|uniref:hypothetical protein n=1 Tax=Cupriavidus necator TaxID=106590 RepID=UPI0039C4AA36